MQLLCYVKRHNYRDRTLRQDIVNIYSHCSMRFSENLLMTTTQIHDQNEVLNGVWRCIENLKKEVPVELVCIVEEATDIDKLDRFLLKAQESDKFKIKQLKVLFVQQQEHNVSQLFHHFEDLVYSKPHQGMPGPDNETIELSPEQMKMVVDVMRSFDESGMSAFRKITCKITAELDNEFSVYTEILKTHLNDAELPFQSFRYFKNQLEQTA